MRNFIIGLSTAVLLTAAFSSYSRADEIPAEVDTIIFDGAGYEFAEKFILRDCLYSKCMITNADGMQSLANEIERLERTVELLEKALHKQPLKSCERTL